MVPEVRSQVLGAHYFFPSKQSIMEEEQRDRNPHKILSNQMALQN